MKGISQRVDQNEPMMTNWNSFYMLLFHSLFKVEFDIDHFVLGEHWER